MWDREEGGFYSGEREREIYIYREIVGKTIRYGIKGQEDQIKR
jgi:hypothetical protein